MTFRFVTMLSALALAACAAPHKGETEIYSDALGDNVFDPVPNGGAFGLAGVLTPDGLGPLRIGMTRAEALAAIGEPDGGAPAPEACELLRPASAPAGVEIMFEEGVLTRISLEEGATLETDAGLGVGARAAAVKAEYGARAVAEPHKYLEAPAEYITIWTSGSGGEGSRGFVYEVGEDGKVFAVHAGGPSITYIEGCD